MDAISTSYSGEPKFGTQPIRCGKRACKWRGYETDLKSVPHPKLGAFATQNVCPTCGCDSYSFMTPKEIAAWERTRGLPSPSHQTFSPADPDTPVKGGE